MGSKKITMLADDLKQTTADVHAQLEKKMDILSQLSSRESYQNLLTKFYQFYLPTEEGLKKFADGLPLDGRLKIDLLKNDLKQLGLTDKQISELPSAPKYPDLKSLPEAVGALYVLEGSTMGGQVISKQLRTKLDITPETGGSFFWAYGEKTMPMWLSFKSFLNTYEGDTPKVLESAKTTFLTLENWLC